MLARLPLAPAISELADQGRLDEHTSAELAALGAAFEKTVDEATKASMTML